MADTTAGIPARAGLGHRLASAAVMGSVGMASRLFLYGLNRVEVTGLDNLLGTLDRRKQQGRERGLLTVCNHVAVLDDPLIWGILPARYAFDPDNLRWGLGAHDICFKNKFTTNFFSLGQVLPTHRAWHSPHGGLHQPTMAQAIRLLSGPVANPIIAPGTKYSTDGSDSHLVPSVYESTQKAWVHIFPEACCHQNPESTLRYFKWGVSRLILESDPAPEFIPMFIHGTQHIMAEDRGFPRFLPRVGKTFRVMIGEPTDVNALFGEYRARWRALKEKASDEELKTKPEAVQLRIEVASKVRDEIAKLRQTAGFPVDHDETAGLADTWTQEPNVRKFKSPVDGSLVNRH